MIAEAAKRAGLGPDAYAQLGEVAELSGAMLDSEELASVVEHFGRSLDRAFAWGVVVGISVGIATAALAWLAVAVLS